MVIFKLRLVEGLSYSEIVGKIIELNEEIQSFWSQAQGWAPSDAASLLGKSRLDWLASLSYSLYKWEKDPSEEAYDGDLILAWGNLGALVEGNMKFFLSVFYKDYQADVNAISQRGYQVDPDGAMFNGLRKFFLDSVWSDTERDIKNDWLKEIQGKRNAIYAYRDREIGDFIDFRKQVKKYLLFQMDLLSRVPYPDDRYGPDFTL